MVSSFIVVPQWQGSGSSRAMQLAVGADAVRGDLPVSTVVVPVPLGAGSGQGSGVHRLTAIQMVRAETRTSLEAAQGIPIVVGGDCGIELAAIEHAATSVAGRTIAVLWFDAHADLNTPASSPSGAFHGMVLRTLLGDGLDALVPAKPLVALQVVLAGVRALDAAEAEYIEASGIRMLSPDSLTPKSLAAALKDSGAHAVYIHIDLDVLDPGEFAALDYPEPFGLSAAVLIELIRAARATLPLAGAGITEFAPGSPDQAADDLPTILRIIGALTS